MEKEKTAFPNLLKTKLYRPPVAPDAVTRYPLIRRLEKGVVLPLTLVSAPAGYGKSTLISQWLAQNAFPSAWVTLGKEDNNLQSFLRYFVSALRSVVSDACPRTWDLCNGSELPPESYVAEVVVEELQDLQTRIVLVLDEYKEITAEAVHGFLRHLFANHCKGVHVVILARRDPPFALFRMRAVGQMAEIRQRDLRFGPEDGFELFRDAVDTSQHRELLAEIVKNVEGWGVGLRLAKLALQQGHNLRELADGVYSTNKYVSDYLASEVMCLQPPEVQDALRRLSIVDRFSMALFERLVRDDRSIDSRRRGGDQLWGRVCRSNLFIIRLDAEEEWFRFHHFFRDFLRGELARRMSREQIALLHKRAAVWFEESRHFAEAMDHACASGTAGAAEGLLERCRHEMMAREQWQLLDEIARNMPDRPGTLSLTLLATKAWTCEQSHRFHDMFELIERIDRRCKTEKGKRELEGSGAIRGEIEALWAARAAYTGIGVSARDHAMEAARLLPDSLYSIRSFATAVEALGHQMTGRSSEARKVLLERLDGVKNSNPHVSARSCIGLCVTYWRDANYSQIERFTGLLRQLAEQNHLLESLAFSHYFSGAVAYDRNELDAAEESFVKCASAAIKGDLITFAHSSFVRSLTFQALGRDEEARAVAGKVQDYAAELRHPSLLDLSRAFGAELDFRQERYAKAEKWLQEVEMGAPGGVFRYYVPHLTRAKLLVHFEKPEAAQYLGDLEEFYLSNHSTRVLIDVLALQAILADRRGESARAHAAMQRAVSLAVPSGIVRAFIDLGPEAARLLHELRLEGESLRFAGAILAAFRTPRVTGRGTGDEKGGGAQSRVLIDPLSKREEEVLALMAEHLSHKDIAARLFLSPQTVKTHAKRIYGKLSVHGREAAVAKATGLGLLGRRGE